MWYLCICQQPDNSDLAPTSSGAKGGGGEGAYGLRYSGRLAQVGNKVWM